MTDLAGNAKRPPRAHRAIWTSAFLFASLLHAGLAAAFLKPVAATAEAAEDQGLAVTIELAPLPVAQAAEEAGEPAPDSAEATASPPAEMAPEVTEKLSAQAAPDEQPKVDATPYEPPPDTLARKETDKKEDREPDEAEATNESQPVMTAPAAAAAAPSASGAMAPNDDEKSASPKEGSTLEAPDAPATWQRALLKHIARHKRYPKAARLKRAEGVATVEFTVSRTGGLLSARLTTSSGSELLDLEALEMLKRAQPLPKFPREVSAAEARVVLPIRYRLR